MLLTNYLIFWIFFSSDSNYLVLNHLSYQDTNFLLNCCSNFILYPLANHNYHCFHWLSILDILSIVDDIHLCTSFSFSAFLCILVTIFHNFPKIYTPPLLITLNSLYLMTSLSASIMFQFFAILFFVTFMELIKTL